jgi:hypothetical protein
MGEAMRVVPVEPAQGGEPTTIDLCARCLDRGARVGEAMLWRRRWRLIHGAPYPTHAGPKTNPADAPGRAAERISTTPKEAICSPQHSLV